MVTKESDKKEKLVVKSPSAALMFYKIYLIKDAVKALGELYGGNVVRVFPSITKFKTLQNALTEEEGAKIFKELDDETIIGKEYSAMIPEEQALHRCFRVVFDSQENLTKFLENAKSNPELEHANTEAIAELCGEPFPPNDLEFDAQWGHVKTNVGAIWKCATGCGQIVAIVDTGMQVNTTTDPHEVLHPDLRHQMWETRPGRHGYNTWNLLDGNMTDLLGTGHGEHVAGIVAARANNHHGTVGVAPNAKLLGVNVAYPNDYIQPTLNAFWNALDSRHALGIYTAVISDADVINCSWSFPVFPIYVTNAINWALTQPKKPVFVVAAGNDNIDVAGVYPANHPGVLTVASTDTTDTKSIFSNYGSNVAVAAPGENIYSTLPGGAYGYMTGTSMAAPYVSAMVAIIRSKLPGLSQAEYKEIVQTYVAPVNSSQPIGTGRIDFTYLSEILCGCGCGPCGYRTTLEERKLLNATALKEFVVDGEFNTQTPAAALCIPMDFPTIAPNFYLHWGDSAQDHIETHDTEILYIRVCNPYCNIGFKGLKILKITITPNYVTPNGEPAVELAASSLICYDELRPMECASREYALITANTAPGPYTFTIDYCIDEIEILKRNSGQTSFTLNMVNS